MTESGFFITCKMGRETKSVAELKTCLSSISISSPGSTADMMQQFYNELGEFKSEKFKFDSQINVKNVIICKNLTATPISEIYSKMRQFKNTLKHTCRIIPISSFVKFRNFESEVARYISELNSKIGKTYKISYEHRITDPKYKESIFSAVVNNVTLKVNLKCPDYILVIQAVKNLIGLSLVENGDDDYNFDSSIADNAIKTTLSSKES